MHWDSTNTLGEIGEPAVGRLIEALDDDDVHRTRTGAPSTPVIRNADVLATSARESIRVFRTVVIPGITEHQVLKIAEFIADFDPTIPYRLIGFRPNFILCYHPGPGMALMNDLAEQCKGVGLTDVAWSGHYPTEITGWQRDKDCCAVSQTCWMSEVSEILWGNANLRIGVLHVCSNRGGELMMSGWSRHPQCYNQKAHVLDSNVAQNL